MLAQLTPGSKTVVRLRLMHWTGMRPSQMAGLQKDDSRLDATRRPTTRQGRSAGSDTLVSDGIARLEPADRVQAQICAENGWP